MQAGTRQIFRTDYAHIKVLAGLRAFFQMAYGLQGSKYSPATDNIK